MDKQIDLKQSVLKGYLREFYCKPNMSPELWNIAKSCIEDKERSFYGIRFSTDLAMKQFVLAVLLSSGKQFNWLKTTSYGLLQDNLAGDRLITEYGDLDLLFVIHEAGTMRNAIMGQSISQVALQRAPLKTFFFDRGGYTLNDLVIPIATSISGLVSVSNKNTSMNNGDNL